MQNYTTIHTSSAIKGCTRTLWMLSSCRRAHILPAGSRGAGRAVARDLEHRPNGADQY